MAAEAANNTAVSTVRILFGSLGFNACSPINRESPGSCDPKQQAIVAVRDGVLIRSPKQQAATLQVKPVTSISASATCT